MFGLTFSLLGLRLVIMSEQRNPRGRTPRINSELITEVNAAYAEVTDIGSLVSAMDLTDVITKDQRAVGNVPIELNGPIEGSTTTHYDFSKRDELYTLRLDQLAKNEKLLKQKLHRIRVGEYISGIPVFGANLHAAYEKIQRRLDNNSAPNTLAHEE